MTRKKEPITKKDGAWHVDGYPGGKYSKRVRRKFPLYRDAEAFWFDAKKKAARGEEFLEPKFDRRTLDDIADAWYEFHGNSLADGKHMLQQMKATARSLGNPLATKFTGTMFLNYRTKRLEGKKEDGTPAVSKNHLNHELTYLKAAFNVLIKNNKWLKANPLKNVSKLKIPKRKPFFLQLEQVEALLAEAENSRNPHLLTVIKICLSTACRWGEAEGLWPADFHSGMVHFIDTKNGKDHAVPIDDTLRDEALAVGNKTGPLFNPSWKAFSGAVERAGIVLPRGTNTHVLRHTAASHHVIDGGDILELNKILNHDTIQMTLVYAHLAPKHLQGAKRHNPIAQISRIKLGRQKVVNINKKKADT